MLKELMTRRTLADNFLTLHEIVPLPFSTHM